MPVHFYFPAGPVPLKNRKQLKQFIIHLFDNEGYTLDDISYVFCTDDEMLPLNQHYLQHQTYTDILTFDLSSGSDQIQAEIYISIERVRENAKIFQTSIKEEVHRVIFHGALHLCGYNDQTARQKKQMRAKENEYLQAYFQAL